VGVGVAVASGGVGEGGETVGVDVGVALGRTVAVDDAGAGDAGAVGFGLVSSPPQAAPIRTAVAKASTSEPAGHLALLIAYLD